MGNPTVDKYLVLFLGSFTRLEGNQLVHKQLRATKAQQELVVCTDTGGGFKEDSKVDMGLSVRCNRRESGNEERREAFQQGAEQRHARSPVWQQVCAMLDCLPTERWIKAFDWL